MANWCNFNMNIVGTKEDCKAFRDILKYNTEKNFERVYEAETVFEEGNDKNYSMEIFGNCAWSVACSMVDKTFDNRPERTTLAEESKRLNLDIEVYSTEPGMCFAEHFRFKNGRKLIDDCVDYNEFYWNRNDFPTIEELNAEYGTNYTEDDFDMNDCHIEGGFGDWIFAA